MKTAMKYMPTATYTGHYSTIGKTVNVTEEVRDTNEYLLRKDGTRYGGFMSALIVFFSFFTKRSLVYDSVPMTSNGGNEMTKFIPVFDEDGNPKTHVVSVPDRDAWNAEGTELMTTDVDLSNGFTHAWSLKVEDDIKDMSEVEVRDYYEIDNNIAKVKPPFFVNPDETKKEKKARLAKEAEEEVTRLGELYTEVRMSSSTLCLDEIGRYMKIMGGRLNNAA